MTFSSFSLLKPFRYLLFSRFVSLAFFTGILSIEGCLDVSMFWLETGRGMFILDNEYVLALYGMTLEDFGVFMIVLLVMVEMKLFSMNEVILACRLGLSVKSFTNLFNPYKKLSSLNILSDSCMIAYVVMLTFLLWLADRFLMSLSAFFKETIPHSLEHNILASSTLGEFLYEERY